MVTYGSSGAIFCFMDTFVLEDLDLIADNRIYDLAKYFGLEHRDERLENKDALKSVLDWGEQHAKTSDVNKIILAISRKERGLVKDGMEPRLSNFRRNIFIESLEPARPKQRVKKPKEEVLETKPEVQEDPKEEVIRKVEPSWADLFKQGMNET